jgi:hypothetical protein
LKGQQFVAKLDDKHRCVKWLNEEAEKNGENKLIPKTIKEFPNLFGRSFGADWGDKKWWVGREEMMKKSQLYVTRYVSGTRKSNPIKARAGRGKDRQPWIKWLYHELRDEFQCLLKAGVPMHNTLLVDIDRSEWSRRFPQKFR